MANIKQLAKKLFAIIIANTVNKEAVIVDIILYTSRLFGLTIGFLIVSAGLFLKISKVPIIPMITLILTGKVKIVQR